MLRALADVGFREDGRLTSIYCESDAVCPPSSCRLDVGRGAHLQNFVVARGGHFELVFSSRIAPIVCRELDRRQDCRSPAERAPKIDESATPAARAA
jgi:hypothetical protein